MALDTISLMLQGVRLAQRGFSLGPVSVCFGPGIWRVEGGNGTGKSTLLRAMAGDLRPVGGRIVIREGAWEGTPEQVETRRKVGYVPVEPEQPDFLRVREAWQLMAALRNQPGWAGEEWEERLGLGGDWRLGAMSTGQRRKAEILCALAGSPPVLLLDETLAPLDAGARTVVGDWLSEQRTRRVIVLVHHGVSPIQVDGGLNLDPIQA